MLVPRVRAAAVSEVAAVLNSGTSCTVGLVGERGSGRSSVLRQIRREFPNSIALDVSSLMAASSESEWPGLHAMLATGVLAELLRVPTSTLGITISETRPPRPATVALALWQASQAANRDGRDGGLLWVIDDFDLLDDFSQAVVTRLATIRVARGSGVLLAVAEGSNAQIAADVQWIPLRSASPVDVRQLVEGLVGFPLPWRVATRLTRATGGDLRAVRSTVQLLDTDALRGLRLLPHPLPLDERTALSLLASRQCEDGIGDLLAALALEERLPIETARRIAGDGYPAALAEGTVRASGGTVVASAPAHALSAWWLIRAARQTELYRMLGGRDGRAAMYSALTADRIDPDRVCAVVAELLAAGDHPGAVTGLTTLEHRLPPSGSTVLGGLFTEAYFIDLADCLAAVAAAPGGWSPEVLSRWTGELSVLDGRAEQPVPVPQPLPEGASDDEVRQWLLPMVAACRGFWHRDDLHSASRLLEQLGAVAELFDDEGRALVEVARAELAIKRRDPGAGALLAAAARSWCEVRPAGYDIGVSVTAYMLMSVGELDAAASVIRSGQPREGSGPLDRSAHLASKVHWEVAAARYQSADQLLREADQELPVSAGGVAHLWAPQVETIVALGVTAEREELARRFGGGRSLQLPTGARADAVAADGRRALVEFRFGEAAALLPQALGPGGAMFEPRTAVLGDLLEAERAVGSDDDRIGSLLARYGEWLPDRGGPRFASLMARCEAAATPIAASREAYRRAAELADERFPVDRARALLAGARRHADEPVLAIDWLNQALAVLDLQGLCGWADHARRLRQQIDPDAGRSLTDVEQRIVEQVLQGKANAEIARSLFISKRSLELQLTRIYRALGVRGKSELRAQHAAVARPS